LEAAILRALLSSAMATWGHGRFRCGVVASAVVLVACLLGACAADPDDDPRLLAQSTVVIPSTTEAAPDAPPPITYPANGEVAKVQAIDNNFRKDAIEIVAGTEVQWQNRGRNDHNIVPIDGADWGVIDPTQFGPKATYSFVFTTPGTYAYYCSIHGTDAKGMVGTITVTAPAG
jgi:plastocyanin